ncbi:uncharacterized protein LOC143891934 [Tasmannia lanceolata]|uniref:uncharacterized protein LOC143891934 n=1 Tax=Tasmannia lanceolata TaxID=3420 RepID=UPI004064ADFA
MALSGTVILFALCRQKPFAPTQLPVDPNFISARRNLRSCISSGERKREEVKKKKKRVHFADNLVELVGDDDDELTREDNTTFEINQVHVLENSEYRRIPVNRMALYNGILQDRLQRMAM